MIQVFLRILWFIKKGRKSVMFCKNCGSLIGENNAFCTVCGARVDAETQNERANQPNAGAGQ